MNPLPDLTRHFARLGGDPVRTAFQGRRPVMPWLDKAPVPAGEVPALWDGLLAAEAPPRKRLVYIHVPFCATHCLFCGFYRYPSRAADSAAYADLVVAEIEREADTPAVRGRPIHAVYLGGGTPTALAAPDLARIVSAVRRRLPLAPDCEITVEGRVILFDDDKVDACLEAGANRFSIGVQSFDTEVRRRQGRRASREEVIRFVEGLRDRDRAAVVIDLLFGLPGQTPEVWRADLDTCAALEPDGVDLYCLNVFPGTPLHKAVAAGKSSAPATLDEQGALYRTGLEVLAEHGWRHISNSHWARTTRERNLYNLLIKDGADCLAYGSGAGGSLGNYSYTLAADLGAYRAAVEAGCKPIDGMRTCDALQPARDAVTAGFEAGRLDLRRLRVPGLADPAAALAPLFEQWGVAGLVERQGAVVRTTTAGRFWSNNLMLAVNDVLTRIVLGPQAARPAGPVPDFQQKRMQAS